MDGHPSKERVLQAVVRSGVRSVRLVPFMLVAGAHYEKDLAGGKSSWLAAFAQAGMEVQIENQGLGMREAAVEIFIDHIREALDVIPAAGVWGASS